ncbi:MAG: ATP-dependent DNA helicase [Gemmataceae bacterium]|nr:ATP-dependent DNA helicase [Gemmataceae bacterium]
MSIESILGTDGSIAERLGNYEAREEQLAMARAVEKAVRQQKHLMVEAGTGVGKSFAYLVPAIQAALANKDCRVVVSTHTISLQEQLIRKDLPFLQSVFDQPFTARLVKGRSNYLSKRRLRVARQKAMSLLDTGREIDQLEQLAHWTHATKDGSRSDLRFQPLPKVWDLVESDSSNCLGRKCTNYANCYYYQARKDVNEANVLVVNHALYFVDMAIRSIGGGQGILPKHQVVIFDEAHTLEDVAADHLGIGVSRGQVEYLLNRLLQERRGVEHGLLATQGDDESRMVVRHVRNLTEDFFEAIASLRAELQQRQGRTIGPPKDTVRLRRPEPLSDRLSPELLRLANALDRLAQKDENPESQVELESASMRCQELADSVKAWLAQKLPGQVYWIEGNPEKPNRLTLASAPIEVGPILREQLFGRVPSVLLTSATLSVGGTEGFRHLQDRLGFPREHPALQLGSPFDYRRQAELHLFREMPDPNSRDYEEACLAKIRNYVTHSGGRAFVLFTSTGAMMRAAERLRNWFVQQGFELLCQGESLSPTQMVERFKTATSAVLFGVDSFWQGVDVQGEALQNVIITKLPFVPPDRPIVEARIEAIEQSGGNAFFDFQVPLATIKLKQGFGRLIRTKSDRGMVVILDPRMLTKPYGRRFLEALPRCRKFIDGQEVG